MFDSFNQIADNAISQSETVMQNVDVNALANATASAAVSGVIGAVVGLGVVILFIVLLVWLLTVIAQWKIFTKAGEKGWKAIIPIYNMVVLFKIAGISPLWVLGYFIPVVPVIGTILGPIIAFGITIYAMINLSKAFGKSSGFAVGLVLLNTIFMLILGFGSSEYQLNKENAVEVEQ